jgi:hypothetical protein
MSTYITYINLHIITRKVLYDANLEAVSRSTNPYKYMAVLHNVIVFKKNAIAFSGH